MRTLRLVLCRYSPAAMSALAITTLHNRSRPALNSAGGSQAGLRTAPEAARTVAETTQQLGVLVDISDRELRLFDREQLVQRYPVAVGTKQWSTPTGS